MTENKLGWEIGDTVVVGKNSTYKNVLIGKRGVIKERHGSNMVGDMYSIKLNEGGTICLDGSQLHKPKAEGGGIR